ncbi:universal stress protein [Edaphobacter paludis]|uniref:Universal stress protein n=1 Tax=Edaphobacter paludis TaxID=3035702 RepID=A0AAU7D2I4_9BACT
MRYAAVFARTYGAGIVLAHAYIPPTSAFADPEISLACEAMEDLRHRLENRLLKETQAAFLHDIKCTTLLRVGGSKDLLDDLSNADLIVVGTSGETGLEKAALGSVAETIFRSSRIPVLTVGPHCRCGGEGEAVIKTVLYATDFSPGATIALPYALSIAKEHQAELILLYVKDDNDVPFSFERTMASEEPLEKLHQLTPANKTTCIVGFGRSDAVILAEAKNRGANLIVIGARGVGAFASVVSHFGGGTAYKVAASADCPVFTIREA